MRLAALVSALALAGAASAATADGNFSIKGAGGVPCSTITADLVSGKVPADEIAIWLMGYISATNRTTDDTWDITGAGGVDGFATATMAYCANNPDALLETAAFETAKTGFAGRTTTKP